MDHALAAFPRLKDEARAEPAKPRPRPRGPVLMGDLTSSWGGRPLLLAHWDDTEED